MSNRRQRMTDLHCAAFWDRAREYKIAADALVQIRDSESPSTTNRVPVRPIYFLYAHAAECALKAYIRVEEPEVEVTHNLRMLYEGCISKGLELPSNTKVNVENVIGLIQSGNENHGFRYLHRTGKTVDLPELAWASEIVAALLQAIEPHVSAVLKREDFQSKPTSIQLIIGKPKLFETEIAAEQPYKWSC